MARQARSLDVLLAEINAVHGDRSKVSDGGLGDPAHASRVSDHNPNSAGVWRARDFTDDQVDDNHDGNLADVLDCNQLAAALVAMYHAPDVHPAMRSGAYTIWRGRIYSYDRRNEGWRPYPGPNPHDKHLHQSVATLAAGYDSTAPWGVMEGPDMTPDQDARLKAIEDKLDGLIKAEKRRGDNQWRREAAMAKALKDQGLDVDAIRAAVDG